MACKAFNNYNSLNKAFGWTSVQKVQEAIMVKQEAKKSDLMDLQELNETLLSGSEEDAPQMESDLYTYYKFHTLQSRLKFVFTSCGKSQRSIAHAIGITPQSLGQWTRTGRASRKHLLKVASFLDISGQWLIDSPEGVDHTIIGQRLKSLRTSARMSLDELANHMTLFLEKDHEEYSYKDKGYIVTNKILKMIEDGDLALSGDFAVALKELYRLHDMREIIGASPESQKTYLQREKYEKFFLKHRDLYKFDAASYMAKKPYLKSDPAETIDIPYINQAEKDNEPALSESFSISWLKSKGFNSQRLVLVSCNDDSMMPRVNHDDIVLIDKDYKNILSGKIYAINYAGEPIIRRLSKKFDGSLIIQAENSDYPSEEVTADQAQSLDIIGRAVWHAGPL